MHRSQQRLLTGLGLLLLGLVALIKGVDVPEDDAADYVEPITVRAEELTGLMLVRGDTTIVAERTAGGWLLLQPLKARADDRAIDGLVGVLDRLRVGPVLEGLDPAVYGLNSPQATLTLSRKDGGVHELAVGTTAPVGFRTYVTVDGGGIQLAEGQPMTTLGRPVDALRDRSVHLFAESAVTGIQWVDEGLSWQVIRRSGGWFLGDGRRASTPRVEALLASFADLRLESFQDGLIGEDLTPFGLAPPFATVTLTEPSGQSTLAIGGERAGGVLVRTPTGVLGTVGDPSGLLPAFDSLVEDRALPWSTTEATSLEVVYAGVTVTLTRDGHTWLRDGEPSALGQTHAVDLLTQLPADRSRALAVGTPSGDTLVGTAGAYSVRVELGDLVSGGRVAWTAGEPAWLLPSDALAVLENVALNVAED